MSVSQKYVDIMKATVGNIRLLKTRIANYFVENTMTNYSNYPNSHFIVVATNVLSFHSYAVTKKLKYLVKLNISISI